MDKAELRSRAEESLKSRKLAAAATGSALEAQRLVHELQVHQIELEMQNDELRSSRNEVEAAAERYTDLYDFAPSGYFTLGRSGAITRTNLAGALLLGFERARLAGRRLGEFIANESLPVFNGFLEDVFRGKGKEMCDVVLQRKEAAPLWVHIEAVPSADFMECRAMLVDISECRKAEYQYLQSNRLLRTIREVDQAIVHEANRDRLLQETCRILAESAAFKLAWIGFMDPDSGFVKPVTYAGFDEGYTEAIKVRWDDSPEGWGPCGTAIRTGEPVVYDDLSQRSGYEPWRQNALKRGYRSSAAFPLRVHGQVVGVLAVYADKVNAIDARDISMLEELTADLGHALQSFDDRATREKAEAALALSEERFRTVVEAAPEAIFILEEARFGYINEAGLRLFGASRPEDLLGRPVLERFHPDFRESVRKRIQQQSDTPHPVSMVRAACLRLDGTGVDVEISAIPLVYRKQAGILVFAVDIGKRNYQAAYPSEKE